MLTWAIGPFVSATSVAILSQPGSAFTDAMFEPEEAQLANTPATDTGNEAAELCLECGNVAVSTCIRCAAMLCMDSCDTKSGGYTIAILSHAA